MAPFTAYLILLYFAPLVFSRAESAWNGHTTHGSTTPALFTPYYVPPGAKSYDSTSPLIHYSGKWAEIYSASYIQRSIRRTTSVGASATFTFTGTGIEWFGNSDNSHGLTDVFIDGELVQTVDAWGPKARRQQRNFWKFDLQYGKHTVKIVNVSQRKGATRLDIDAFVVTKGSSVAKRSDSLSSLHVSRSTPQWTLTQRGSTGVHAMQLAVISDYHALIVDKVEHNPLNVDGHPAWAALYNFETHAVRPLRMQSNSFCAGGTFLSNGTLINVGGNPVVEDFTAAADFGDLDGLQAIRIFERCDSPSADSCEMRENHARNRMASPRWYNTVVRLFDGSAMIIGGSKKGGWINNATVNNPTVEYFPPKAIHGSNGMPIDLPFLVDTLNSNLFPIAFALPDGNVFVAANRDAMIYDWQANKEIRLPQIPNGVRVTYPMAGTGLLLPLHPENNYAPEILLCGGSTLDDGKPGHELSSQDPASAQCSRMVLTDEGIAAGWQVERMPHPRIMPDAVLLPTGDVFIVNGAGSGISGYANVRNQVGESNADNPVLTPVLYNPKATVGARFTSKGLPTSQIPRLYHSVATLTPSGNVMVAGSNPNLDRSEVKYGTEYRVEWMGPPYMGTDRPEIVGKWKKSIGLGETVQWRFAYSNAFQPSDVKGTLLISYSFALCSTAPSVALMDLGYVTHAVHANSRLVYLVNTYDQKTKTLHVTGPPDGKIYPPGPGWVFVVIDGIPSRGVKIMIGDGQGPEVDEAALKKCVIRCPV
jgi:hypothetical protein